MCVCVCVCVCVYVCEWGGGGVRGCFRRSGGITEPSFDCLFTVGESLRIQHLNDLGTSGWWSPRFHPYFYEFEGC